MDQTDGTDGSVDIGVSLSGGGHRATLFGLGVLLYLAHAHDERDQPLSRRVAAISSVSGGSITNGFLAQSLDYRCAEAVQVEVAAQTLATQLAEHGVLFARRRVHILQGYPLIDLPPRRFSGVWPGRKPHTPGSDPAASVGLWRRLTDVARFPTAGVRADRVAAHIQERAGDSLFEM